MSMFDFDDELTDDKIAASHIDSAHAEEIVLRERLDVRMAVALGATDIQAEEYR